MPKHILKKQKEDVVKKYKEKPITIQEMSEIFKLSAPSIMKILDEYRIKRYSRVQLFSPELDEHYFETIDSEAKAYFLGLIITDGCVHHAKGKQPLVSLTIKDEDAYLLERFKDEIRSNKNITRDGRGCSELNILSTAMVNDLRKYGVVPRKSLVTAFPKGLKREMYPHLIRGILDGDGSVSYYARPNRRCHVKAVRFCNGNEKFLIDMVNFLSTELNIQPIHTYREKENLWSVAYRKNSNMIMLINYMYDNASIYMKRKKRLCDLVYAEAYKNGSTEITSETKKSLVS